jgi:predicted  nucleic acid-binding Zn-ribbon protein
VTETEALLQLHDADLAREELASAACASRLRKLGAEPMEPASAERARDRLVHAVDRRWVHHYERAKARYGRAVAVVRERVCAGCYITLPTSASPSGDQALTLCESCGRILYWR